MPSAYASPATTSTANSGGVAATSTAAAATSTPPAATSTAPCVYLTGYLGPGRDNNPDQVRKLQTFLRDEEGFGSLSDSGVYDQLTQYAVSVFQLRYADSILKPWGASLPSGIVYITTRNKINGLYCKRAIPLTPTELAAIGAFKINLAPAEAGASSLKITTSTISLPTSTVPAGTSTEQIYGAATATPSAAVASVPQPNPLAAVFITAGNALRTFLAKTWHFLLDKNK